MTVIERARDIVLEMRETTAAADRLLGSGQRTIRVLTPGWLDVFFHDGRYEIDQTVKFRESAQREIQLIRELVKKNIGKRGGKSAKPAKSGRLDFLKRVFIT